MKRFRLLYLAPFWLGCGDTAAALGPEDALRRFLGAMTRAQDEPAALAEAFSCLDDRAQARLRARAERATSLSGREYQPHDMLVPGRFHLRFDPAERGGMRAIVQGDRAEVQVRGRGEARARVPLVREGGRWRVVLEIGATAEDLGGISPSPDPGHPSGAGNIER